jgi:exodeoxyribonuclease V gamma subunit
MLRLVYSNRTEELLASLGGRVRSQQAQDGPLVPVRIIVPSASMEAFVRLGIARVCGVAANLEVTLPTRYAAELVLSTTAKRAAGADVLEAMALTLLLDDAFLEQHADLAPVRAYVHGSGAGSDGVELRRVQLAARVGRLFEEYTYSRAEMLAAWVHGTVLDGGYGEVERWQRRLWLAMFGEGGLAESRGVVALHEAAALVGPQGAEDVDDRGIASSPALHVFGFAHFARTFHAIVARVSRRRDVYVYSLSPCEGFWEDVDPRDPAPLNLWGRLGREHVRALNASAGFDHDDGFVDPPGRTLLAQLQRDLLRRQPAREAIDASFAFGRDESVRVLEHASIRRELEAVASEIWRLVAADESLRFDEIGVLLPDAEAHSYLAHLPAVFGEAHEIPHQIAGLPLAGESRVAEAIDLLLALPLGRFTRQELLRLAVHPAVVASLEDADPSRWLAWCDALGVVHGADRSDHEGTYIERDLFNWDQGLRRLALGAFMAGDASGERAPFALDGEAYVPFEVAPSDLRDAAMLGLLLRSLVADARFARDAVLRTEEWAKLLATLVETYVAPPSESDAEPLAHCLRRLQALGDVDLGDRRVPYRVACELARARIAALPGGRRGEGVIVSRIASMRAIPLRIAFACGLGEGHFPSADAEDPLDLRWAKRQPGDVTARERDKYAFLELLLSARDRLYASYVSRDALTGDTLAPASVVQELLHALERGYVGDLSALRRRHPLRRWDPRYFPEIFGDGGDGPPLGTMHLPEARAEARTLALRRSLEAHGGRLEPSDIEARAEQDSSWRALADTLGLVRLPEVPPLSEAKIVVPMYALAKFLEFPLQGWARFRVGLDELDDDDVLARENEPFETDLRDETLLLREVLLAAAATRTRELDRAYENVVRERELRGIGPSGVFAEGERADHLRTLEAWRTELEGAGVAPDAIELHRFGRAGEHARADHVHAPLLLDVGVVDAGGVERVVRAEISGRTLPMGVGASVSLTLLRRAKEKREDEWSRAGRERSALRAFVDHAVLSASGAAEGRARASLVVVATPEEAVTERCNFAPLSRDEATVWLRGLVRELLGGPHAYFFACEAVFARQRADPDGPAAPWLEQARDKLRDREGPLALRSAYGPVPRPQEYPVPAEERARAMIAARFGVFFAKREAP